MAKPNKVTDLYGCIWHTDDRALIERECIKQGGTWTVNGKLCGMGLAHHVMEFAKIVWPWFKWHRWAKLLLDELCRPRHRLGVFGPSSAGKSSPVGLTYLTFYAARPDCTTVLVSSTTRDELSLRIWGEIVMMFREAKEQYDWFPGFLTASKQMITTDGKDEEWGRDHRNGIIGRPVKIGNKWLVGSGTSPFVGIKNDYVYLAADEAGLMPSGFLEALANLVSNPQCSAAVLGNLGDLDTPLGQVCEPKNGWDSLPDSNVSRAYDTRWSNGRCVQFVGMDSPNLDYPADAEPYPKLIGRRYIDQCAHDYGRDTPFFNMFAAGAIPRGTMENRIITRQDCERAGAFDEVIWGHETVTWLYAMDLSYTIDHGDRTVGRPFAFGRDSEGNNVLAPMAGPTVYAPSDRSDLSIVDQLALQCAAECKRWDIPASRVFYDGTGRSDFTAALMRVMGTAVNPIEFGGTATKRPNFVNRRYEEDLDYRRKKGELLTCDEVFDKMVSELWFALRALVEAKQARNLDIETVKEASKRLYKASGANRISVEPKAEVKIRLGRSPDLADCFVGTTKVLCADGLYCYILDLRPGDYVMTPFGLSPIVEIHEQEVDETYEVTFSDGSYLEGKANHRVFTWDRGWVRMDSLSIDNDIESINNLGVWHAANSLFTKDKRTTFKVLVDILRTEGKMFLSDFYIELYGSTTLGLYLRVMTFTTRMITGEILSRTISNCVKIKNTVLTMLESAWRTIQCSLISGGPQESKPLQNGIAHQKEKHGILKTQNDNGKRKHKPASCAKCADATSILTTQIKQSTVPTHAKEKQVEHAPGLLEIVKCAVIVLKGAHKTTSSIAPVTVRRLQQPGRKKVYCFTLAEHNVFYANGILVENCAVAAIEGARRLGFALGHLTKENKKPQSGWFSRMQRQLDEARSSTELVVA